MSIQLQAERTTAGSIAPNESIVFDAPIYKSSGISYDNVTGVISLLSNGVYHVNWWVATQANISVEGTGFALSCSDGQQIKGNSPLKTGEISGIGIINVVSAPITMSLVNIIGSTIYLSPIVNITTASITVVSEPFIPAYGTFYTNSPATVPFGSSVPLDNVLFSENISLSLNTVTVANRGIYQFTYNVYCVGNAQVAALINNLSVIGFAPPAVTSANTSLISFTTVYSMFPGATIQIQNLSSPSLTLENTNGNQFNVQLTVVRIA